LFLIFGPGGGDTPRPVHTTSASPTAARTDGSAPLPPPTPPPRGPAGGGDGPGITVARDKGSGDVDPFAAQLEAGSGPTTYNHHYLLTVVRGCDYNSVVYRNPRELLSSTGGNSASPATEGTRSPVSVLDSLDIRAAQSGMPEGANCGELAPQWVIVL